MDDAVFAFGSFRLHPGERLLLEDGKPLRLGSRAFEILITLVERAGETVPKDQLIGRVWPDTVVDEGALRVHVTALRKALGDGRDGNRFIGNIPGRGYNFVGPVTREQRQETAAPPRRPAPRGNLPAQLTRVIGRGDVIATAVSRLSQHRLLTIIGPGGIGKTTTALTAAEATSPSFPDGVWFVELSTIIDAALVPSAVAATLGISPSNIDPLAALVAWLRDKHLLIVLDCCEHVLSAAAAIAEAVLRGAPGVCILATSREPLRAEGEWRLPLPSLKVPSEWPPLSASEALGFSAVELFNERATAAAEGFVLSDDQVPDVLEICRRLDGMPLALELAAAQIDIFGVKGLAARLENRLAVLTRGRRTALPRHRTLRAAIDWSYGLLSDDEQRFFRSLGIFAGGFTVDAAAVVVLDAVKTPGDAIGRLADLVAKSLVVADVSDARPRFRLLDTTRAYAIENLDESGESERIARRHAEYYRNLFERAEGEAGVRPTGEWLADYAPEIDNLRKALDWTFSSSGDAALGITLTATAVPLWMHLSLVEECRIRVEQALAAVVVGAERDARCEMVLHAALAASLAHRFPGEWRRESRGATLAEIDAAWTKALEIAESLDDREYRLRSVWGLWFVNSGGGRHQIALEMAQRFGALAANRRDRRDQLVSALMIGASHYYLGDLLGARHHLDRMLADYASTNDRSEIIRFQLDQRVMAQVFLARVLWILGFPDQAARASETSIAAAEAANHAVTLCYALTHAACPIGLLVGDLAATEHYAGMLRDRAARHGLSLWRAWSRGFRGLVLLERGDVDAGLEMLRTGFDEFGEPVFRAPGLLMAEALRRAGRTLEGESTINDALAWAERSEERWITAGLLHSKGEFLLLQNEPAVAAAAEDHFQQALDWARRQSALSWELRAARSLARLLADQGRFIEAKTLLQPIYDRFTEGFDTADLKDAKALLDELM